MKPNYKTYQQLILIGFISTIISIILIDKPLAILIHQYQIDNLIKLRLLSEYIPLMILATLLIFIIIIYHKPSKLNLVISAIYVYCGLEITLLIKTALKVIFGRYWPKTWLNNNLSLIKDNIYGFDWWHGMNNQGSFPSGHSTYIAYCTLWLCILRPKANFIWILLAISGIIPQIMLDYHFLGDCLAGVTLGVTCGLLLYIVYNNYIMPNLQKFNIEQQKTPE